MDFARCILVKYLVVPNFVARCLHVSKDARDPSGDRWNYLSRRLFGNFAEMIVSSPFTDLFLATNLRQGCDGDIYVICYEHNMTCNIPCKKSTDARPSIICAAFGFVI